MKILGIDSIHNDLVRWKNDCLILKSGSKTSITNLYESFLIWNKANKSFLISKISFSKWLKNIGFIKTKRNNKTFFLGVKLK